MSETKVRVGQRWRSLDGARVIEVVSIDKFWEDVVYINVDTGRRGAIFCFNLRKRYALDTIPTPPSVAVTRTTNEEASDG